MQGLIIHAINVCSPRGFAAANCARLSSKQESCLGLLTAVDLQVVPCSSIAKRREAQETPGDDVVSAAFCGSRMFVWQLPTVF